MNESNNIIYKKSIRIKDYDYSQGGYYFVTICTNNRENLIGIIDNGTMILNDLGSVVEHCIYETKEHYPNTELDYFCIMPNHVHFIIIIKDKQYTSKNLPVQNFEKINNDIVEVQNFEQFNNDVVGVQNDVVVGVQNFEPLQNRYQHIIPKSLGSIIRGFKIGVTKWARQNLFLDTVWQKNYYEHIIRNDKELYKTRKYIELNSLKWTEDEYFS
jgi:putative transposase